MRQAFAGMLWSKQLYYYDVSRWLEGDPGCPPPPAARRNGRNARWRTFNAFDILSMPDKWEYPWFAAWDLAFHCVTLAHIDPAFAKYQLILLCREWFQHPNGAIPAYEWDFSDVNPPVQAWAALEVFAIDGGTDFDFLSRIFDKLLINFTWWVNRQDESGSNVFEGGFLGLDNIGPLDRSHLPAGATLQQSDATGWMAFYAIGMAMMGALLNRSGTRPATTWSSSSWSTSPASATRNGPQDLWDDTDGLAYDRLVTADGSRTPVKVRSMVGVIPLLAAVILDESLMDRARTLGKHFARFLSHLGIDNPASCKRVDSSVASRPTGNCSLASSSSSNCGGLQETVRRSGVPVATRPARDLGLPSRTPLCARSARAASGDRLRTCRVDDEHVRRQFELARADLAAAQLLARECVRALRALRRLRSDDRISDGSGTQVPLDGVINDLWDRLISIFLVGPDGRRPCFGGVERMQRDPAWKDNLLFHEYFHGDNGAGLGATHQTGWTGIVADMIRRRHGATLSLGLMLLEVFTASAEQAPESDARTPVTVA